MQVYLSIYLVSLEESSDLSVLLLLHHMAVIRLLGVSYLNVDIITLFICVIKTIIGHFVFVLVVLSLVENLSTTVILMNVHYPTQKSVKFCMRANIEIKKNIFSHSMCKTKHCKPHKNTPHLAMIIP